MEMVLVHEAISCQGCLWRRLLPEQRLLKAAAVLKEGGSVCLWSRFFPKVTIRAPGILPGYCVIPEGHAPCMSEATTVQPIACIKKAIMDEPETTVQTVAPRCVRWGSNHNYLLTLCRRSRGLTTNWWCVDSLTFGLPYALLLCLHRMIGSFGYGDA